MALRPDLSERERENRIAVLHEEGREVGSAARRALITTLVESYELRRVAVDACRKAGISGRAEQVAYCLVALCQKADPVRSSASGQPGSRTYGLDVGAADFAERLGTWADIVARNLSDWAATYAAIHEEADRFEITTIRSLIRVQDDDLRDVIADKLTTVLTVGAPRLEEMTLAHARDDEPIRTAYVFQSPLARWVAVSARRQQAWTTERLDAYVESIDEQLVDRVETMEGDADRAHRQELSDEVYRALVHRIAAVAQTRDLLSVAMREAERVEQEAALLSRHGDLADSSQFQRVRAELAYVLDDLHGEQRAFGNMLAYIMLAMGPSPNRQLVAILSLRSSSLEPTVNEHITARMHAVLKDAQSPVPSLIVKASVASRNSVPANRAKELTRMRDDRDYRSSRGGDLAALLDRLPLRVAKIDSALEALTGRALAPATVRSIRSQVVSELTAVDTAFGRAYRRYAMGAARGTAPLTRYVAALPIEEEALNSAISQCAREEAARTEVLLHALRHRDASERARAARHAAQTRDIAPPIAAQLAVIAGTDTDDRARAWSVKALAAHGLPVPAHLDSS